MVHNWYQEIDLQRWYLGIGLVVSFSLSTMLSSLTMGDGMLVNHGANAITSSQAITCVGLG